MLAFSTGAKEGYELDTMLVESHGMTEVYDSIVGTGEWQVFWNQSDGLNGVPYAKKLDLYVDRKGSLELHAQSKALFIIPRVHGICERQLFHVALREKSNFLKHAGKSARRESTTRKTENTDVIPDAIVLHQKLISVFDVLRKVPSDHLVQQFGRRLDDWRPKYTITRVSSDPGLVIDELLGRIVLLQHR